MHSHLSLFDGDFLSGLQSHIGKDCGDQVCLVYVSNRYARTSVRTVENKNGGVTVATVETMYMKKKKKKKKKKKFAPNF